MKNRCGRVLAALLCFAIFTGLFSTVSFADRGNYGDGNVQTEGDFRYQVIEASQLGEWDASLGLTGDRFARLVGYTGMTGNLTIPSTLGGCPVVWIGGGAFKGNNAIQTVTVGANVYVVDNQAFADCAGLQTVLIALNVRTLGTSAFQGCAALKTVTFQKGSKLESIGESAFNGCSALNGVAVPDGVITIGRTAFANCDSLTEIVIPDSVSDFGSAMFFHCDSLQKATIGNGVSAMSTLDTSEWYSWDWDNRYWANWGCESTLQGAFEGCVSLIEVSIGDAIESVEADCFAGCEKLKVVRFGKAVRSLGECSFQNAGLEQLSFPDNLKSVGSRAFRGCSSLKSLDTGDNLVTIGNFAFENNTALQTVRIGSKVRSIGDSAFRNCDSLKNMVIPSNVEAFGSAVFFSCDSLESVAIGNGVKALTPSYEGDITVKDHYFGTFENCVNLKAVTMGSALKTIGIETFRNTGLTEVSIPDNVTFVDKGAFRDCASLRKAEIGNGVITVGDSCFESNSSLTDISIGTGVISMGIAVFRNCDALKRVYVPSNVTSLGSGAFYDCGELETVVIGNGVTAVTNYEYNWETDLYTWSVWGKKTTFGVFENCPKLTKVTLGSGLTKIGYNSFCGTAISTLTVPQKVSAIGDRAFAGAGQLENVYFAGSWDGNIGTRLFDGTPEKLMIHYIDGKSGFESLDRKKTMFQPVIVSFDNNSDEVFASPTDDQIMSPQGDYVIEPIAPVALGYVFGGWYADRACTKPWDFKNTFVTKNTTLYAKWTPSDELVPARPANVSVSENDGGRIALRWSEVDGAQAYNVYCNGVKANAAPITETAFTVAGIRYASTYELTVSAVNAKGESEKSLIAAVNTPDDPRGEFGGHYYLAVDAPLSLADAQAYAQERGGHLASVTTPEEQAFVSSLLDGKAAGARCRIGFARVDGAFAWVTGEQTDYVNWAEGQPGDGQSAALLRDGGAWVALEADAAAETGFLIEWDEAYPAPADGAPVIPAEPPALELPDVQEPAGSGTRGDADGDGRVTARDARLALRASARLETLEPAAFACVDLNGDGKITAAEARKILRYSAKLETSI